MNETLILHHYDSSPYAEKVRLMFGLTDMSWQSVLAPVQPPRPSLDPLTGGYRRIPVAQLGADIFCDTAIIGREIATMTDCPALDPQTVDASTIALMEQAENKAFFAAIGAVPPMRLIVNMVKMLGPVGTYRFIKDRAGLMKGGTVRPPQGEKAKAIWRSLMDALETRLTGQVWVDGDSASIADFAIYHPLWLHVMCNGRPLEAAANVQAWYKRVGDIGHGQREEMSQDDAFAAAKNAQPRAVPAESSDPSVELGTAVRVAPSDYGIVPVQGTLVSLTQERVIVARETAQFGTLHVHFPRDGYSIKLG